MILVNRFFFLIVLISSELKVILNYKLFHVSDQERYAQRTKE